jgi:hypothetical protein
MRARLLPAFTALTLVLAACNAIFGLDGFDKVDCVGECTDASLDVVSAQHEAGGPDADADVDAPVSDADSGADADADASSNEARDAPEVAPPDVEIPAVRFWARWPMPTADEAGADGGAPYMQGDGGLVDTVTGLVWEQSITYAPDFNRAASHCATLGAPWTVPTRIELVTLIDASRAAPAWNPAFDQDAGDGGDSGATAKLWTASGVAGSPGTYWVIDFATGGILAGTSGQTADSVRCVIPHGS